MVSIHFSEIKNYTMTFFFRTDKFKFTYFLAYFLKLSLLLCFFRLFHALFSCYKFLSYLGVENFLYKNLMLTEDKN